VLVIVGEPLTASQALPLSLSKCWPR